MTNQYQIHKVNDKFSVTLVRELEEEQMQGYEEVGRFDSLDEATSYAGERGAVIIDFDVLLTTNA